jgi:DNA-binding NarL/FixJ family response regulator
VAHTILIVDDNPLIRKEIRAFLEAKTDWAVCGEASDGKIAIDSVRELKPDVVLLDFQMPVMNGLDAARLIAEISPSTTIVMLTMLDSPQLRNEARFAGVNEVLSKCGKIGDDLISCLLRLRADLRVA